MHLAVFEGRASGEGGEGVFGDGVFEGEAVLFLDPRGGVGDAVGESAVVGEDEQARRVRVQAPRGHETRHIGHQVGDLLAAALVFHGGQVARRFVQSQIDQGVGEADPDAVESYLVFLLLQRFRGSPSRR